MRDQLVPELNPLLAAFLAAGEASASERLLVELVDERIDPIVRRLIQGKLHASLQPTDDRQVNQDAWDLVSEVKTQVVAKLSHLKIDAATGSIDSLEAYVKTISVNACNQYLRKKYPKRLRLKNQLRYLLSHDRRFELWRTEEGEWHSGLRELNEKKRNVMAKGGIDPLANRLKQEFEKEDLLAGDMDLADLLSRVFSCDHEPLRFVDLVSIIYELQGIREPLHVPEDEALYEHAAQHESDFTVRLEQAEFLKDLWQEIGHLPLRHRAATLLNLRSSDGDGLIALLPLTRTATVRQIAEMLEFPIDDFVRIWNELPWDDRAIADHLKLTRQQVINLRQSARATLRRRLDRF